MIDLVGHTHWINSVDLTHDGSLATACSWDKTVRVWDIATCKEIACFRGHQSRVRTCCFSPDASFIASGSTDKKIFIWSIKEFKEEMQFSAHTGEVEACCFATFGNLIASGGDESVVRLWNYHSGHQLSLLEGHTRRVTCCTFSPQQEKVLATSSLDGTIRLWDTSSCNLIAMIMNGSKKMGIRNCAFSVDGKLLATGGHDGSLRVSTLNFFKLFSELAKQL
jgi:WD40 repeat protein